MIKIAFLLSPAEAATLAALRAGTHCVVPTDAVGAAMYLARKHGATNTHAALAQAMGLAAAPEPGHDR